MSKETKEQIEYDGPERMDQGIQSKLEKGAGIGLLTSVCGKH